MAIPGAPGAGRESASQRPVQRCIHERQVGFVAAVGQAPAGARLQVEGDDLAVGAAVAGLREGQCARPEPHRTCQPKSRLGRDVLRWRLRCAQVHDAAPAGAHPHATKRRPAARHRRCRPGSPRRRRARSPVRARPHRRRGRRAVSPAATVRRHRSPAAGARPRRPPSPRGASAGPPSVRRAHRWRPPSRSRRLWTDPATAWPAASVDSPSSTPSGSRWRRRPPRRRRPGPGAAATRPASAPACRCRRCRPRLRARVRHAAPRRRAARRAAAARPRPLAGSAVTAPSSSRRRVTASNRKRPICHQRGRPRTSAIIRRLRSGPAPSRQRRHKSLISLEEYRRDKKLRKTGRGLDCRAGVTAL